MDHGHSPLPHDASRFVSRLLVAMSCQECAVSHPVLVLQLLVHLLSELCTAGICHRRPSVIDELLPSKSSTPMVGGLVGGKPGPRPGARPIRMPTGHSMLQPRKTLDFKSTS